MSQAWAWRALAAILFCQSDVRWMQDKNVGRERKGIGSVICRICRPASWFFAVFSGVPAAIGFVFLCDLCDSARAMKPNETTAQIVDAAYRIHTQLGQRISRRVAESPARQSRKPKDVLDRMNRIYRMELGEG
jgi:hypothetical protein